MSNENKLFESIINSGKEQAKVITDDAQAKAGEVIKKAENEAKALSDSIARSTDSKALNMKNSALSSASLITRNANLEAKRNEINKTLYGIKEYILSLDDKSYFRILYSMAKDINEKNGTLLLSEKDKSRLPSDFAAKIKEAGIDAEISNESADIDGGFILRCGNIEINCTLDAVIEDKKNELEDYINSLLFSKES